jgi:predicted nucleic acid-binding protein
VIFVDTSFWLALGLPRERRHELARSLLAFHGSRSLVTSNLVRGEGWTFLNKRLGHWAAVDFLDKLAATRRLTVSTVSEDVEDEAWEWLRRHDERPYSFVDATSFALMRRLRIREALAFDGDFAAAGFVELRP